MNIDNMNLIFVDVEATNLTPFSGEMTEFGAVHYHTRKSYHGVLFDAMPDPECPAKPVLTGRGEYPQEPVMRGLASWLKGFKGRPVFVSDGRTGGQPDLWVWDGAGWSPHPGGRGVQGR